MRDIPPAEVTNLLLAWRQGDADALNKVAGLVYQELRRLARCHLRGERPDHTLQTTALAHEAYLRLIDVRRVQWHDRAHFLAMASRMMRRVLVYAARARHAAKRDGGLRVTLDPALGLVVDNALDLVALNDALDALARLDARKSQVVELRFFGGLTLAETAAVLQVSEDTVGRDWNFVKSCLRRELAGSVPTP